MEPESLVGVGNGLFSFAAKHLGSNHSDVSYVLVPPHPLLVEQHVLQGQERHTQAKHLGVETAMPRGIEIQSINRGQHVDSTWGNAELRDHIGGGEVIDLHVQLAKRCTERNKGCVDAFGVTGVRTNPNIHVSGGSWQTMGCQSDAANDQEPDIVLQQRIDEVAEISVHGPGY